LFHTLLPLQHRGFVDSRILLQIYDCSKMGTPIIRIPQRTWLFQICPAPLSLTSVAALRSADTLRPAPAVAALLNASDSEGSQRGPYQAQSSLESHTSKCRAARPAATNRPNMRQALFVFRDVTLPRFFSFLFCLLALPFWPLAQTLSQASAKINPAPLSHPSVTSLPSADTLRSAPAVAARLNASGSKDSHHRGPYQQAQRSLERHTSECRAERPAARPAASKRLNILGSSLTRAVL
jgi:hypothetical protein